METAGLNPAILGFVSTLLARLPPLTSEQLAFWVRNPRRMKKLLSQLVKTEEEDEPNGTIRFGRLVFSLHACDALLDGKPVDLSPRELVCLLAICEADGIATYEEILLKGKRSGHTFTTPHQVVKVLRDRLEATGIPGARDVFVNVQNAGYRLDKAFLGIG